MIISGWELLSGLIEPDIADQVRILSHDPTPLVGRLADYPKTLVHGDPRIANLGVIRAERPRLVMLDFARSTLSAPTIDLAWYLSEIMSLPVSAEESIEYYKRGLRLRLGDLFSETWWQPVLELGLLAGFVLHAWAQAYTVVNGADERERSMHKAALDWWSKAVVPGIERLSE